MTVGAHQTIQTDICIIGAGPAGISTALGLGDSGLSITLVDEGGSDRHPAAPDEGGEVVGRAYDIPKSRRRGFGGTAGAWKVHMDGHGPGLRLRRLDPHDLEPQEAVPGSAWPISWDELAQHYPAAESLFDLPSDWADHRDLPWRDANALLAPTSFSIGSAGSFLARETLDGSGVDLQLGTAITRLITSGSRIRAAEGVRADGRSITVEAEAFVLAAGGIENPRFLLDQVRNQHLAGVATDQIGRTFMEHLHTRIGFVRTALPWSREFERVMREEGDGVLRETWLRIKDDVAIREGTTNTVIGVTPVTASSLRITIAGERRRAAAAAAIRIRTRSRDDPAHRLAKDLSTIVQGLGPLATGVASRIRSRLGGPHQARTSDSYFYRLDVIAEQVPNQRSRIELSDRRDVLGRPLPRLNWKLADSDIRSLRRVHDLCRDLFSKRSDTEFVSSHRYSFPNLHPGFHHMGTTRMESDAPGVVDSDCRVLGTENLYVAGSSVFPSGGVSNPTLTIVALATRLADHLATKRPG